MKNKVWEIIKEWWLTGFLVIVGIILLCGFICGAIYYRVNDFPVPFVKEPLVGESIENIEVMLSDNEKEIQKHINEAGDINTRIDIVTSKIKSLTYRYIYFDKKTNKVYLITFNNEVDELAGGESFIRWNNDTETKEQSIKFAQKLINEYNKRKKK